MSLIELQKTIGKNILLLRTHADLSQAVMAELAGVKLETFRDAETAKRIPNLKTLQKIADVSNVGIEALVSLHCNPFRLDANGEKKKITCAVCHDTLAHIDAKETRSQLLAQDEAEQLSAVFARIGLMMNRREIMQALASMTLGSTALVAGADTNQEDSLQAIRYGLNGGKVGGEVAEWARNQISHLSRLDDLIGGKNLYPVAQSNLNLLQNLLHSRAVTGRDEQELRIVLAHTASQAGWFAQDAEQHNLAVQHYHFGIEMARSASDRDLAAYCMMWLASQAMVQGNPSQCLSLLEVAEAEAGEESALRNHLLNFAVKAHGLMGNFSAVGLALARGEMLYDKLKADRIPEWLYWMRRPSLTETTPRAFLPYEPRLAAKFSEDALAVITTEYVRDRMVMLVELAKAKHALGDTDEAVSKAMEVLQCIRDTAMPRVEKNMLEFEAQLPDSAVTRPFKELFADYLQMGNARTLHS